MKKCVSTGDLSKASAGWHGIRRSTSLASLKKEGQRKQPALPSSRLSCAAPAPAATPCWSSASTPASPALLVKRNGANIPRTPPRTPPGLPKPPHRASPTPRAAATSPLLQTPRQLPPQRSVTVFRHSICLSSLSELLASCEQLEGLVHTAPQQPMVSTMCKMLASSLGRSCKSLEGQLVSPASWNFSPDAFVTACEFKFADVWTLDAAAAERVGALEMEQHDLTPNAGMSSNSPSCTTSSSAGSGRGAVVSRLPRVHAYKRPAVGAAWSLVGTSPANCSDIHQHLSRNPQEQLHDAGLAVLASEPVAVARACKLALQQGLSLKGLVVLLQAAADGLHTAAAQLQQQQQQQQVHAQQGPSAHGPPIFSSGIAQAPLAL